ncbi:TPA: cell division protein FtsA [Candidatus Dojkabacteria bacterium]|jgi:cell division protein FtsA|uniref:Cell division protein FtsA n=1 Tax=Candidatus Dojkabacteria bacterium TaxID=2099670 RepID=A0A832QBS0_9BACT|nr:cell division protein FtsA [Candidatus Dojkabacteria bacterium]HHX99371.1 cell division protein FtsA [Candidatus Dojkabacteria bacterium]
MARKIITAIDVGTSKVTTLITSVEDGKNPTVIGVCAYPSKGIRKGVVVNIDDATSSILESVTAAERMAGVTVSDVVVSINGEQVTSLNNKGVVAVAGSEITIDDTYRAIENARTLSLPDNLNPIHIIPREFVVDSQGGIKYPIGMSGGRLEVETHIITAPNSYWQNIKKCVEQVGATVSDVIFTAWASSLAVLTDTEKELGVTLLDIGAGTTGITIFQEGSIIYSACVPLGGISITSDIAIGLQVSLEEAEKIKVNMNTLYDAKYDGSKTKDLDSIPTILRKKEPPSQKKKGEELDLNAIGIDKKISKEMLDKIVSARCEEIFEMVKEDISKAGYDMAMPAGIVLTGGSSLLRDITKYAQDVSGVVGRVAYPSGLTGMTEEISDPAYACVQGSIKHAIDDDVDVGGGSGEKGRVDVKGFFGKMGEWFKSLLP